MKPATVGIAVGLALAYVVGYNNIYARSKASVAAIQLKLTKEKADQDSRRETSKLLDQVKQYQNQIAPEADPSWLVQEVMPLARKTGVNVASITPQAPEVKKQATTLSVSLQLSATYHQLGKFLDEIEHSKHFINVDQVNLSPPRSNGEKPSVQVVLSTLYIPSLGEKKAEAPVVKEAKSVAAKP